MCVVWLLAATANAATPAAAITAYHAGNYLQSAAQSESEGSAAALAFAAQALIADAITRKERFCVACLERAQAKAEQAIELDPQLIDGYIQRAVAIGFRGRAIGISEARSEGLAEKARESLDKAIALDRANIWARASLGAWHLEIVHHAGPILAEFSYGASRSQGLKLYREALAEAPNIAILHFHYALSLLALDQAEYQAEAQRALTQALSVRTNDALTLHCQAQAKLVLEAALSGSLAEQTLLVQRFQGYPDQPQN